MLARFLCVGLVLLPLGACTEGGLNKGDGVYAPGPAGEADIDGLLIGHRLMAAGEYELALTAYLRAAGQQGLNADTLSAIGSANLMLGRLGQAEAELRRATDIDPTFAAAWNNLGVVLMNEGKIPEAAEVFRLAYGLDDGNSDSIRDNLRLALAKLADPAYVGDNENEQFQLVRRGPGDYLLLTAL